MTRNLPHVHCCRISIHVSIRHSRRESRASEERYGPTHHLKRTVFQTNTNWDFKENGGFFCQFSVCNDCLNVVYSRNCVGFGGVTFRKYLLLFWGMVSNEVWWIIHVVGSFHRHEDNSHLDYRWKQVGTFETLHHQNQPGLRTDYIQTVFTNCDFFENWFFSQLFASP